MHQFGLEDVEYEVLERDIDIAIHCAASVNLVLPYSALYRSNVTATFNIVSFCNSKKLKPLHFVRYCATPAGLTFVRREKKNTVRRTTKVVNNYLNRITNL